VVFGGLSRRTWFPGDVYGAGVLVSTRGCGLYRKGETQKTEVTILFDYQQHNLYNIHTHARTRTFQQDNNDEDDDVIIILICKK